MKNKTVMKSGKIKAHAFVPDSDKNTDQFNPEAIKQAGEIWNYYDLFDKCKNKRP